MGDLAAIFSYMKTLDPGSTVREGEAASAQNAAGIPERVRNYYNNLISGERLSPEQRADMAQTAITLYNSRAGNYNALAGTYSGLLQAEGADPIANGVVPPPQLTFEGAQPRANNSPSRAASGSALKLQGHQRGAQSGLASGASVQQLVEAATAAGANVTAEDVSAFQQAVEARAKGQPVTFRTLQSGTRSPLSHRLRVKPDDASRNGADRRCQCGRRWSVVASCGRSGAGLEALNPVAGMTGEIVGSALALRALPRRRTPKRSCAGFGGPCGRWRRSWRDRA